MGTGERFYFFLDFFLNLFCSSETSRILVQGKYFFLDIIRLLSRLALKNTLGIHSSRSAKSHRTLVRCKSFLAKNLENPSTCVRCYLILESLVIILYYQRRSRLWYCPRWIYNTGVTRYHFMLDNNVVKIARCLN